MEIEEIQSIVEILMQERSSSEDKLSILQKLTQEEINDLYLSLNDNFDLLRRLEDILKKKKFQKQWEFIEQCTEEMIKLKK